MSAVFYTLTDGAFLPRVLALHRSLEQTSNHDIDLLVYCFDDESHSVLLELDALGLEPVSLADLERAHPELLKAKADRTPAEYCWTAKPAIAMETFRRRPDAELIAYLDADLLFFSDPESLFAGAEDATLYVTPHRHAPHYRQLLRAGYFNSGFIGFRRSEEADRCLARWHHQCLESCHDRVETDRYADQKYLDDWPALYAGVRALVSPTVNVAPWNWEQHTLSLETGGEHPLIDGRPILFAHYSGVRMRADGEVEWAPGGFLIGRHERSVLLEPYAVALTEALERIRRVRPGFRAGLSAPPGLRQRAVRAALTTLARTRRRFPAIARIRTGNLSVGRRWMGQS